MKKIKLAVATLILGILAPVFYSSVSSAIGVPSPQNDVVFAASLKSDACDGLDQLGSNSGCGSKGSDVTAAIRAVVGILSYVVGAIAIIMVIVSGFKYITSSGDSNRIASARSTLVYALVGLAIAALAQFLVHFVLHATEAVSNPCPSNKSIAASDKACK
jgi:hypothetical protein